jgi:thiol:disulfide interchange protein
MFLMNKVYTFFSLITILFLFSYTGAYSQLLEPVTWKYEMVELEDDEYELIFTADIEEGWTVYSMFLEGEDGPIPTEIIFEEMDGIELVGEAVETGDKKEGPDPFFDNLNVIKFYGTAPYVITQRIKVTDKNKPIKGYLGFMTCDDTQCLPPTDVDFAFYPSGEVPEEDLADLATLFDEDKKIDQRIESLYESFKEPIVDCGTKDDEEKSGYFWTFLFGFIGGLIALLTPCVFPMIPITVSFFTKDSKRSGWMNGTIYGICIIFIYVTLGLLITIVFGEDALNRLSTNWIANTLFFLIFIVFAFSFFGFYEITLPSSWTTKSDQMADKGGLLGIFFMAFTLALVSFSCTGPIIGTALVQAASKGEYLGPFLVMFGFSLALALPFGLFAAFPAWLNTLPKSGGWMNSVKVTLGFLELALALKFLSVADMTNHWGFLRYELFMGAWILIFLGLALYLFGFIRFPHDTPGAKIGLPRKSFGVMILIFSFYLLTGFKYVEEIKSYNALTVMSGLAPPTNYNFFLAKAELDPEIKDKYPSYSKCANDISCFKDYYEGLAYAQEVGKPIFLDFTGHGCVNCRKMEEHVWVDQRIRTILNEEVVLISLYVDDDEKLKEILFSIQSQKKLRDVGNMWTDFQISNFEQNSQPLYIMATSEEIVMSPAMSYKNNIEDYLSWLQCSLATLNN